MKTVLILLAMLFSLNTYATNCIPSPEKPAQFNRTIDTIGDSITWFHQAERLRCLMLDNGLRMDFLGKFLDPYGYHHDGHGGDSTFDTLKRIHSIPKSDSYFLLVGVNDIDDTAMTTFLNIQQIAHSLYQINNNAKIFVSTLIPIDTPLNNRNNEVNKLLREKLSCIHCVLVDTGEMFASQPNWQSLLVDKVHPTAQGYELIANYLVTIINKNS